MMRGGHARSTSVHLIRTLRPLVFLIMAVYYLMPEKIVSICLHHASHASFGPDLGHLVPCLPLAPGVDRFTLHTHDAPPDGIFARGQKIVPPD